MGGRFLGGSFKRDLRACEGKDEEQNAAMLRSPGSFVCERKERAKETDNFTSHELLASIKRDQKDQNIESVNEP